MMILKTDVIKEELKKRIEKELLDFHPSFYLYLDKRNQSSISYINSIEKMLDSFSLNYRVGYYDTDKSLEDNLSSFKDEMRDDYVLLARPIIGVDEKNFITLIDPSKDIDMLTDTNRGMLFSGDLSRLPATAAAVYEIIKHYYLLIKGKRVAVVGRSMSVGYPCFKLVEKLDATVSIIHSKTSARDKKEIIENSDVVILATGKSKVIEREYFNSDQTVIDCGYSKDGGDLGFIPEEGELRAYTPVPNGVGKLTSYCLLLNAINLSKKQ